MNTLQKQEQIEKQNSKNSFKKKCSASHHQNEVSKISFFDTLFWLKSSSCQVRNQLKKTNCNLHLACEGSLRSIKH